jgi:predicted Zn finger-like uncharacterized protein
MRLTCPNCGARYEVDDAMIPPEGRDVQCSECSTTWFQPGRRTEPPPQPARSFPIEEAPETEDREASAAVSEPEGSPEGQRESATDAVAEPEPEPEPEPEEVQPDPIPETAEAATRVVPENEYAEADTPEEEQAEEASSARRGLDPSVRDILREEAEREARLRQAEADPVETQSEMPLEEEAEDVHRARRRSELEDAEDAFEVGEASGATSSNARRDLLPDIEEINSTLRAADAPGGVADEAQGEPWPDQEVSRRRGVRIGFFATLAAAAGLFWVYVNADLVTDTVPQAAPAVDGFTDQVDAARLWLDDIARDIAEGGEAE